MGKPLWVVSEDMERDVFMLARKAQAYGIVNLVANHLVRIDLNQFIIMPTIKQLIRNARQPIRNVTKSPTLGGCPQHLGTCTRVYVRLVQIMG
ncbi:hypothetical protein CXB51_017088 [Gossypium anomalum]|uniref:ATP-dependent Clp protease proteolytic subunit n=1 Tax=Gossypium anomalum TaxID=47600 RepID=A0A8J6CZA2_9ROSI|nr:hypothetical protein CXB51_017088 [Gossypium anomalum]